MNEHGKLIAIAVLAVTAVLLLCTLVIVDRMPVSQALANSPDRLGDYILVTGMTVQGDEALYVIDTGSQKIGVYTASLVNNKIEARWQYDLSKLPAARRP